MKITGALLFLVFVLGSRSDLRAQSGDHFVDNNARQQVEMAIALNPLNSNVQLAAWNDKGLYQPGYAFSTDGGVNWTTVGLLTPHGGDPSVSFDTHDIAYYCYLNSDLGRIYVSRTSDTGSHWFSHPVSVDQENADKPYMAIDNTGSVYDGRIYVVWKAVDRDVHFSYSPGGSSSFVPESVLYQETTDLATLTPPRYQCPIPVVGPNGVLYVIFMKYTAGTIDSIQIRRSTNGGSTFEPPHDIISFTDFVSGVGQYAIYDFPSAAVDMNSGRIYVVFHTFIDNIVKINLTCSDDGGTTWMPSFTVGDLGPNTWQFHPWIAVDATGKVSISFLSNTRPTNILNEYMIESFDNSTTFGCPRLISSSSFDATLAYAHEYQGLALTPGLLYPLWTDTRNGNADPYTARVVSTPTSSSALATASGSSPKSVYTSADSRWNAVFQSNGSLYHMYSINSGTSWDGYERISAAFSNLDQYSNPGLVTSSNGNLHAVWVDGNGTKICYNRRVSSSWLSTPVTLLTQSTVMSPGFASGTDDSARIVWVRSNSTLGPPNYWLRHGTFKITDAGPVLRNVSDITATPGSIYTPSIALAADNTSHVVWRQGPYIYYSKRSGSTWSAPLIVSDALKPASSPSIVAIGNVAYLTWQASDAGNLEIYFRSRSSSGTWGSIQNISNNSGSSVEPSITKSPSLGEPCVVWSDNTGGNFDIRYCLPVSGISGSFKSTTLDSHYPTITRYASGGVERLLANWTDGSTTPFIIEQDHHDVIMLLGGEPGKAETTDHPVSRSDVPSEFRLADGYPNPFNPSTRVSFELPGPAFISIVIFDDLGKEVATLVESQYEKGYHSIVWDASTVASGVYYVRMIATGEFGKVIYSKTNKLLLIK